MNPTTAKSTADSFFESATVGAIYIRGLLSVLVLLALLYAIYQALQMVHAFRLLNHTAKIHRAKEIAAPTDAGRSQKEQSGYWG
jgi:uncharacterized membrane protein